MVNEWRKSTWGEELSLEYGKAIRDYSPIIGKYRVFGSNGPIGWTEKSLTDGPGVILGRKGACRGVQFWRDPFWVIDTAYYAVPKVEMDMRWLYYAIKHYRLGDIDDGSPIPSTTRAAVYVQDLTIPPPAEQRTIAHILGTLDDKIELNRRMNQTLEAMAQALFKSWFVDFDGVPETDMQESELGLIPKGWRVRCLKDLLILNYGKALKATDRKKGAIPVYDSGGVIGYHDKSLVQNGSIIIGRKGSVGTLFWEDAPFYPIDTTYYVQSKAAPLAYCYYALQTLGLDAMNTDAAVPGLNRENVYRLEVVYPDQSTLEMFDAQISTLRMLIRSNLNTIKTLAHIRDTLLPQLLSGQLSVVHLQAQAA